jgi:PAS domain S-box-containing protein
MNKEILEKLNVLYVEDDMKIRTEMSEILGNFFGNVYTAEDGSVGLKLYNEKKDKIDVIVSDINMPVMNGIEMAKEIRQEDKKVFIMFMTAFSDVNFLLDAISVKVYDYIIKPVNIRQLLATISELGDDIYKNSVIRQQKIELEKYRYVIDSNNIVAKINLEGNVIYVNTLFCQISGFVEEEVIGQPIHTIEAARREESVFDTIFETISSNKVWEGQLKAKNKNGESYYVHGYFMPVQNLAGEIEEYIYISREITDEINQNRDIKKKMMQDRGRLVQMNKDLQVKVQMLSKQLQNVSQNNVAISTLQNELRALQKENKNLKQDAMVAKAHLQGNHGQKSLKLNKELYDLRAENNALLSKIEKIKEEHGQALIQQEAIFEDTASHLGEKIQDLEKQLKEVSDSEEIYDKAVYWQKKAKEEADEIERLQRKILAYGDKKLIKEALQSKD